MTKNLCEIGHLSFALEIYSTASFKPRQGQNILPLRHFSGAALVGKAWRKTATAWSLLTKGCLASVYLEIV